MTELISLLLKDLVDKFIRENFTRLQTYLNKQTILQGSWVFFDVDLPTAGIHQIKHKQSFVPKDIILLNVIGDYNLYFRYMEFDSDYIVVNTAGPCRIRFLAGNFNERVYGT